MKAVRREIEECFASDRPLESTLRVLIEELRQLVAGGSSSVVLLDERARELVFVALGGVEGPGTLVEHRMAAAVGVTGDVVRRGVGEILNDPARDPRFHQSIGELTGLRTDNLLVVSLRFEGRVIGAINIINKPGGFDPDDLAVAERFASLAGDALGRSATLSAQLRAGRFFERKFEDTVDQLSFHSSATLPARPELAFVDRSQSALDARVASPDAAEVSIWRDRRFVALLASIFISGAGSGISHIAVLWLAWELTKSATATGGVFVCLTLPGVLVGPLAGALADRFPKRRLLLVSRAVSAVIVLGFWLAYDLRSVEVLYVFVVLLGTATAFVNGPL